MLVALVFEREHRSIYPPVAPRSQEAGVSWQAAVPLCLRSLSASEYPTRSSCISGSIPQRWGSSVRAIHVAHRAADLYRR